MLYSSLLYSLLGTLDEDGRKPEFASLKDSDIGEPGMGKLCLVEHNYGARCIQVLGFPRPPPGAATLRTVLRRVDREEGEAKLGAWAERLCGGTLAPRDTAVGIAIDGNPSQR